MATNKMAALQEGYFKRIDQNIEKLAENFGAIATAAQVTGEASNVKEIYDISTRTENIVFASESLLKILGEIRQATIVNDFATINKEVAFHTLRNTKITEKTQREVLILKNEITEALEELEKEYYSSKYRTDPRENS